MRAARVSTVAVLAIVTSSCGRGDGIGNALDASYALGQLTSASAVDAYEAESRLLTSLEFESFPFRQVRALETVPETGETCGVRYGLSADAWGIVPDLLFACGDESARQEALAEARERLRSGLQRSEGEYEAKLAAVQEPVSSMTSHGPTLAYARSLGVRFDLESCAGTVSDLMEKAATAAAALQCETFLTPGASLEAYRARLRDVVGRAEGIAATLPEYPSSVLSPEVARRCGATPGAAVRSVPGSVSGNLGSQDVAYLIRLSPDQPVDIRLSSGSFDTQLSLYNESCSTRLTSDDDGGGGTNSQITWSSPQGGAFVLVVSSYQGSGRGAYDLTISAGTRGRAFSPQNQEALRAFVEWATNASDEEFLSAWRGNAGSDLQLGCMRRELFKSQAAIEAMVVGEAVSICLGALDRATEARKAVLGGGG